MKKSNYHQRFTVLIVIFISILCFLSALALIDATSGSKFLLEYVFLTEKSESKVEIETLIASYLQLIFTTSVGLAGAYVAISIARKTEQLQDSNNQIGKSVEQLQAQANELQSHSNLLEDSDYIDAKSTVENLQSIVIIAEIISDLTHESINDRRVESLVRKNFTEKLFSLASNETLFSITKRAIHHLYGENSNQANVISVCYRSVLSSCTDLMLTKDSEKTSLEDEYFYLTRASVSILQFCELMTKLIDEKRESIETFRLDDFGAKHRKVKAFCLLYLNESYNAPSTNLIFSRYLKFIDPHSLFQRSESYYSRFNPKRPSETLSISYLFIDKKDPTFIFGFNHSLENKGKSLCFGSASSSRGGRDVLSSGPNADVYVIELLINENDRLINSKDRLHVIMELQFIVEEQLNGERVVFYVRDIGSKNAEIATEAVNALELFAGSFDRQSPEGCGSTPRRRGTCASIDIIFAFSNYDRELKMPVFGVEAQRFHEGSFLHLPLYLKDILSHV
ncbi:hypothetical protein [Alteromonas sp. OM2203]|uniref:hypothetical protein n=1 Tax=Alteromonas sp. OM2203 TaxID=3398817 RepID=UPI003AF3902E